MARVRVIGLTLLALAVPTFAFGGEEAPSGPAALSVSASLKGCGVANAQVTCQIDASWNGLEGAEYYTVSVSRPDGVVLDLGQSAGTSRSIFVPYVGPGSYSVQVAAWGTPPGEDEPEVLDRDRSFSTNGGAAGTHTAKSRPNRSDAADDGRDADQQGDDNAGSPAPESPPVGEEPDAERDPCEEQEQGSDDDLAQQAAPEAAAETEQYDPADADGDDRCALEPGQ
jgi:hypothetical protein